MLIQKYDYTPINRETVDGKRHYCLPDGSKVPSVTTILDRTKPEEKRQALANWRKSVGEQRATEITTEAAGVGTAMHANLERFLAGLQRQPGNAPVHVQANKMADQIIINGLSKVNEVWAMEQSLYFPGLYSGTTDLVGVYDGEPAVMDHKQTNKPKKEEWIDDYKIQLVAYILAHNEVYKTDIKRGVVFMCSRACEYQQFDLLPQDFNKYQDMWLSKVEEYYLANR
jgi:genome maintenance exonuclease 1